MKKILIIVISLLVLVLLFLAVVYKSILDDRHNVKLRLDKIKNLSEERIYIITDIIDLSVKEDGENEMLDTLANNRDELHKAITSNDVKKIYKYNNELSKNLTNINNDKYSELLIKNEKFLKKIEKAYRKYNNSVLLYNKRIKKFPKNIFRLKEIELIK